MTIETTDALIIGGGIIGASLAEALAARGVKTLLLERGLLGLEASWAAAGMLAPQSEMEAPGDYMDFCLASRRLYPAAVERVRAASGIDPQYRSEGLLYAAFDEAQEAMLRERAAWQAPLGLGLGIMTRDEARSAEPALCAEFRMAVHFKEDHQIDPRLMTRAYGIAAQKLGAELREYSPVDRLILRGGRVIGAAAAGAEVHAGVVILAAGCWSGLVEGVIPRPPTYPVKGQMLLLQAEPGLFRRTLHSSGIYLVPRLDGRVIVGSTEEHDAGFDKSVEAGAVAGLLARAFELAPALRGARLVDSWAGLRPGTPDRRPILGESGAAGLHLAAGHFRNGVLLAPITAEIISRSIASGKMEPALAPFSITRFAVARAREAQADRASRERV